MLCQLGAVNCTERGEQQVKWESLKTLFGVYVQRNRSPHGYKINEVRIEENKKLRT